MNESRKRELYDVFSLFLDHFPTDDVIVVALEAFSLSPKIASVSTNRAKFMSIAR